MNRVFRFAVVLFICLAVPVLAQEEKAMKKKTGDTKEMTDQHSHPIPKPLDDDWSNWLVGEWQGWSESPMGKTKEWEKITKALDGQFLMREARSEMGDKEIYHGMGNMTIHPETGAIVGYWFDNMRGMYEGEGQSIDGKLTMSWEGYMGTYTQTIERIGEDKYVVNYKFTDPEGKTTEGKAEMTRVSKGKMSDKMMDKMKDKKKLGKEKMSIEEN